MSKEQHADSTPDEKASNSTTLSADEVLVEAARNGDTTAVRAGLEKLGPDTDSKTVAFDAVHEACRGNHDECLALLLPYVETTQMGFGMLLSECIHADHTACTEVLLQHWKSVCSDVAFVPHGLELRSKGNRPCPAMWEDPAVCQVLIDAGADIEVKDKEGRSPLHRASILGNFAIVKMLVKAGAQVCVTDTEGGTCLTLAASFGHTETVRYLVTVPEVDVNHSGDDSLTALHIAAQENHPEVAEVLIDAGADIEVKHNNGRSPLFQASEFGNLRVLKVLVKAGAEVCVADNEGDTCLTLAAYFGHTETVRYLVGLPEVDVNHSEEDNFTALHFAAQENHPEVVKVLIDAGADIEVKGVNEESPVLLASQEGALDVVKVLVKAGAEVCVTDNDGDTCLMHAVRFGHTETARALLCMPEVDVNQSADNTWTALHTAVFKKHSSVVQVLIDAGADIEAKDEEGRSPLHHACACEVGELELVTMLVEAGAGLCVTDNDGRTCLFLAAYFGRTETVRYLVGLPEVDVNHKTRAGETALSAARRKQRTSVVQVLSSTV